MIEGMNVGHYQIAKDKFYNESSDREYLYDDMIDMANETIIETVGRSYFYVNEWLGPYEELVLSKKDKKYYSYNRAIKYKIHYFIKSATDICISLFIDKCISRLTDRAICDIYGNDNIIDMLNSLEKNDKNLGLFKLFMESKSKIEKIRSVYDLKNICITKDYNTLIDIHTHRDDIIGLEKFKQNMCETVNALCPKSSSNRVMFWDIFKRIPNYVKQINMAMYKEYCNILDFDTIDICKFCFFICESMKYDWLPLKRKELALCKAFSTGNMEIFNNLTSGSIIIKNIDVADVLDRNTVIKLLSSSMSFNKPAKSYDMFQIYDCIHFALDPTYTGCNSKRIEDIYQIDLNTLSARGALLSDHIDSDSFKLAISQYLELVRGNVIISKSDMDYLTFGDLSSSRFDSLLSPQYKIATLDDCFNLIDLLISIDPMYLAKLESKDDIDILGAVFFDLIKTCEIDCHILYRNISLKNSYNILLALSTARFVYNAHLNEGATDALEDAILNNIKLNNVAYKNYIARILRYLIEYI